MPAAFLDEMRALSQAFDGSVAGDAIMAVFGVPRVNEDPGAERRPSVRASRA